MEFPRAPIFCSFSLCAYDFSVRRSDAGADPQKLFRGRNVGGNKEETREPPLSGRPLPLSDPQRVATRSRKSPPGKGCCRARRDSFCNLKATRRRRRDRKHSTLLKYPAILRMLGRGRRAQPLRLLARKMLKRPCPRCCGGYLARGPRNRGSCILTASARAQGFPSFDCRRAIVTVRLRVLQSLRIPDQGIALPGATCPETVTTRSTDRSATLLPIRGFLFLHLILRHFMRLSVARNGKEARKHFYKGEN